MLAKSSFMADSHLHSLADHSHTSSSSSSSSTTFLGWDLRNLRVFNADLSLGIVMESTTTPPYFSSVGSSESYLSTGYLEDALLEYGSRSKRRRSLLYTADDQAPDCWNIYSNFRWGLPSDNNLSSLSQITIDNIFPASDELGRSSTEEGSLILVPEIQTPKEAISGHQVLDCSSSSFKESSGAKYTCDRSVPFNIGTTPSSSDESSGRRKKRPSVVKRLVYPFALVKPGGEEGDVTLNDINERILMPPTRPVRHPVGDFACRPCVSRPHGPGLSGKAVVALTRIHTQGRGTITIIRTKG